MIDFLRIKLHVKKPPQNVRAAGTRAFSLLEVLMAMAILATVMLAAYQAVILTLDRDTQSRFEMLAPMLAHQKLAAVYQSKNLNPKVQKGQFGAPFEDYRWDARIQSVPGAGLLGERTLWRIDVGIRHLSLPTTYSLRAYRKSIFDRRG